MDAITPFADTTTPVLGLTKPDVGGSDDTWGEKLNGNFDIIDALGTSVATNTANININANNIVTNAANIAANTAAIATKIGEAPNDGQQYARKNLGWSVVTGGGSGGGASVYVQDTPPSGVAAGSLWWESDTGLLYIYYNDGDSSQWVAAMPVPDLSGFVSKNGDTMSGPLRIAGTSPYLVFDKAPGTGHANVIFGTVNGAARWDIEPGNGVAESGSNAGSHFQISRYNDAGTYVDAPLSIFRDTGDLYTPNNFSAVKGVYSSNVVSAGGSLYVGQGGAAGNLFFGNTNTKYLQYDGTSFNFVGGSVLSYDVNFTIGANTTNTGTYRFGNNGTKYLICDGTNYSLIGGANFYLGPAGGYSGLFAGDIWSVRPSDVNQGVIFFGNSGTKYILLNAGTFTFAGATGSPGMSVAGAYYSQSGYRNQQGNGGAASSSVFNFYYNAGVVQCWIDVSNLGNITLTSDYRIKKDVIDLPGMWDTVKKLRPIKYTQAEFTPPAQVKFKAEEAIRLREEAGDKGDLGRPELEPMFPADNIERWGFVAHELQEVLIPSAATGEKDSPDTVQSPNPFTLIAALTKALQEAMTRIEALEAR